MIVRWRGTHQRFLVYGNDDNQFLDRMKNLMQLYLWIIWKQLVKNLEKYLLSLIEHHKANVVKKYLCKNKDIKLAYLPRGSPHLSMIEEIWRQCKHENIESEFYESIHEIYSYGIF